MSREKAEAAIGTAFGEITLERVLGPDKRRALLVVGRCSCGGEWRGTFNNLLQGNSKTCGHGRRPYSHDIGRKFGSLTVLKASGAVVEARCDCGGSWTGPGAHLRSKNTRSCSRTCSLSPAILPNNRAGRNSVWREYIRHAEERSLTWALSDERFDELIFAPTCYWGDTCRRSVRKTKRGSVEYFGIDRLDNTRGYEPDNVVPCCALHNRMKMDTPVYEFIESCAQVAAKRGHLLKLKDQQTYTAVPGTGEETSSE